MSELETYRKQIDEVDRQIVDLFLQRMNIAEHVAEDKIRRGREVFDPEREQQKLEAVSQNAPDDFLRKSLKELYNQIMAISRKRQYQLLTENGVTLPFPYALTEKLYFHNAHVVFQGIKGAYTDEALHSFFDSSVKSKDVETWREAMEEVSSGNADFAVFPIENSTAGIVSDVYDMLFDYNNYIVGEITMPIDHVLLGVPGSSKQQIRTIYSHPQALRQCRIFLDMHPEWKRKELLNTAVAAEKVARDGRQDQAAIASRSAAAYYGLEILQEKITSDRNATRFIIISHNPMFVRSAKKISICFELPNVCGTLYGILGHFTYNGISVTKIESRPIPDKPFEYRFFIDFEGNLRDDAVRNALRGIEEEAEGMRLLGNY
ncbi:MAG: prephenate dehydratase [Eubacterium sp.]|nr:prephenate dehydratase [Eubacterium sp.]